MRDKIIKTDDEWRALLTPAQFRVLRRSGTDAPFAGELTDVVEPGIYRCAGCSSELFTSESKYHSGCGWPSFNDVIEPDAITTLRDATFGTVRTEVRCAVCDGHLGHVFDDGPAPTYLRYCINSAAITFEPRG